MRKYESITGIHKISNKALCEGDMIHVSEKLDGANASFEKIDGKIHFYSRNKELVDGDTLRGFTVWAKENVNFDNMPSGYIHYGEWLVRHKIKYNEDVENTFVLFDVYNKTNGQYMDQNTVEKIAQILGLKTPQTFYYGEYKSIEHLKQFVGRSIVCEKGEGIVIKNETQGIKMKWVREDFKEDKPVKQPKVQNMVIKSLAEAYITPARIEKFIHKGLDEGAYDNLSTSNYGKIMKWIVPQIIDDVIKEENIDKDKIVEFANFSKKYIPANVRKVIDNMEE